MWSCHIFEYNVNRYWIWLISSSLFGGIIFRISFFTLKDVLCFSEKDWLCHSRHSFPQRKLCRKIGRFSKRLCIPQHIFTQMTKTAWSTGENLTFVATINRIRRSSAQASAKVSQSSLWKLCSGACCIGTNGTWSCTKTEWQRSNVKIQLPSAFMSFSTSADGKIPFNIRVAVHHFLTVLYVL